MAENADIVVPFLFLRKFSRSRNSIVFGIFYASENKSCTQTSLKCIVDLMQEYKYGRIWNLKELFFIFSYANWQKHIIQIFFLSFFHLFMDTFASFQVYAQVQSADFRFNVQSNNSTFFDTFLIFNYLFCVAASVPLYIVMEVFLTWARSQNWLYLMVVPIPFYRIFVIRN